MSWTWVYHTGTLVKELDFVWLPLECVYSGKRESAFHATRSSIRNKFYLDHSKPEANNPIPSVTEWTGQVACHVFCLAMCFLNLIGFLEYGKLQSILLIYFNKQLFGHHNFFPKFEREKKPHVGVSGRMLEIRCSELQSNSHFFNSCFFKKSICECSSI